MSARKQKYEDSRIGVIYARYSSHAQKDASIEQQFAECEAFAKQNGITVIEHYEDRAITGRTDKRDGFQRMMRDAENGHFHFVLAWKSNRIGRNMLQAMQNEAKLNSLGIRCLYVEEDFDNTAAGRFALRSMMNVNQFYSENMAEDVRRGMYDNAAQCKVTNGQLPFGYKKGEDMRYALDPPKDDIVREIFNRVLCGDSQSDIAADLNARGIPTGSGAKWNKNSFHSLLKNERYTGVYIYSDVRIEGGVPQIVDKGIFLRVQDVIKMKKSPKGRNRKEVADYLLTGKLFCGHCKGYMVGVSGTGKSGKVHYYYSCNTHRIERTCDKKNVCKETIERAVAEAIQQYILKDDVIEWMADQAVALSKQYRSQSIIGTLEAQLSDNKRAVKNLLDAIELGIITDTTKNRLLELEKEQAVLTSRLSEESAHVLNYSKDDIVSALSLYKGGNIDDKKFQSVLFDSFLKAVYLYDDKIKIVFSIDKDKNSVDIPFDPKSIEDSTAEKCSYNFSDGSPKESYTNPYPTLTVLDTVFVLTVMFDGKK